MAFKDYSTTPASNTTIGDDIYIGPDMARNDVREALQQLSADGRDVYDTFIGALTAGGVGYYASQVAGEAATETGEYFGVDSGAGTVSIYARTGGGSTLQFALPTAAALSGTGGGALVGSAYGRTLAQIVAGLNPRLRDPSFTITTIKAYGDSFSAQPNTHTTSGDSMVKKYATLQGVASPTISATSGYSSADGQTAIVAGFGTVAATDHILINFGQNDAQFLGTGADSVKGPRIADLARIHLANHVIGGKAAGTNKVAAASASAGQLAVSGTWTADGDLAGAFKASVAGAAMQATFTNCRWGVLLYKAKIGSTGRFYVKREDDDTDHPIFTAAPESAWVPTNIAQTWAVMARVFDFGATLPTAKLQVVIDASTGGGDVSVVGFVGFSGDVETGPLLGVGDVSRRGSAGYATAAGSEVNVPIVNRVVAQAVAASSAMGVRVIDLPVASVIDASTGLDTDAFHPNETGAAAIAAAWKARVDSAAPLAGRRLDLAVQGILQNMGGEFAPGMPLIFDELGRWRTKRIGGRGMNFPSTDNIVPTSTSGVYLSPADALGVPDSTKALLLLPSGSDCYVQGRIGDLIFGAAASNRGRFSGDAFIPETDNVQALGSSSKVWSALWSYLHVHKPRTFAQLPTASASINGTTAYITDSTLVFNSANKGTAAAGGGANHALVLCLNGSWVIA